MATITNSSTSSTAEIYASLARAAESSDSSATNEAQTNFLTLLTTQLKNQDPLNPLDNAQVTSQLAQISTVNGIERLNQTLTSMMDGMLSSETMQAAALVGRSVLVPGQHMTLGEGGALGGVTLDAAASDVQVSIMDATGREVASIDMGALQAGTYGFRWDGTAVDGSAAAGGRYTIAVKALAGEQRVAAQTLEQGTVSSITRGTSGIAAEVGSLGMFSMSEIRQIL